MDQELLSFFTRLYNEDYDLMLASCDSLTHELLWKPNPETVSVANTLCHVCEMEQFWIDWGLCNKPFERDRQLEFDRSGDLSKEQLMQRIEDRRTQTLRQIAELDDRQWLSEREFHGDTFTGKGILLWHLHHLALHRGHVQIQARWLLSQAA